jgi:hypothetical protein
VLTLWLNIAKRKTIEDGELLRKSYSQSIPRSGRMVKMGRWGLQEYPNKAVKEALEEKLNVC